MEVEKSPIEAAFTPFQLFKGQVWHQETGDSEEAVYTECAIQYNLECNIIKRLWAREIGLAG